jgi:hypothetical protein
VFLRTSKQKDEKKVNELENRPIKSIQYAKQRGEKNLIKYE